MHIVEKTDMLLNSIYSYFGFCVILSVLNRYSIYLVKTGKKIPLLHLSRSVIHQMIDRYYNAATVPVTCHSGGQASHLVQTLF